MSQPVPASDPGALALACVAEYAAAQDVSCEPGVGTGELVLTLPGERKLRTVLSVRVAGPDLVSTAFVIRRPDENHAEFYVSLLRRNLRLPGLAYAIDTLGDVFVTGRVPLAAVDEAYVDRLCAAVLAAADEPFDSLLLLGFVSSMRKEWRWRISRGESLRNLESFREVLERLESESESESRSQLGTDSAVGEGSHRAVHAAPDAAGGDG